MSASSIVKQGFPAAVAAAALWLAGAALQPCLAAGAAAAGSVTTDSGGPAISWTWNTIVPMPGEPRGRVLFHRACFVCHGGGPAKPGTRALRAKYHGKLPALLEQRTDLSAAYVKYIVRHGVSVMPPFRKTELSDQDLDAIAAYLSRKHAVSAKRRS
ncbi:MAG: c-type cytochrome [Steroidobacteraceae bacterium]